MNLTNQDELNLLLLDCIIEQQENAYGISHDTMERVRALREELRYIKGD